MNYGASYLNALFKALSGMEEKATLAVAIAFFSQHIERKSILTMCKQKLSSAPSWPGARNTKNIVFLRRNEVFSSFLAGGFLDRPAL